MKPDPHPYQAELPVEHTFGDGLVPADPLDEVRPPSNFDIAMSALRDVASDVGVDPHARLRAAELLLSQ